MKKTRKNYQIDTNSNHSVWKPLSNPVDEWPLAVCDGTTVSPEDLIETDSIRQRNVSTHYYARYDPGQRWYFLDRQTPDEALVFKHFDSKPCIEAPCKEMGVPEVQFHG